MNLCIDLFYLLFANLLATLILNEFQMATSNTTLSQATTTKKSREFFFRKISTILNYQLPSLYELRSLSEHAFFVNAKWEIKRIILLKEVFIV